MQIYRIAAYFIIALMDLHKDSLFWRFPVWSCTVLLVYNIK